MKYVVMVNHERFEIEVGDSGRVWVNSRPYDVDLEDIDGTSYYSLLVNNRSYEAHIEDLDSDGCLMMVGGRSYRARLEAAGARNGNGNGNHAGESAERQCATRVEVRAPLPGLLVEMCVEEGECVGEQDVVAVLESMKMNLELRAPRSGVVCGLHATTEREVGQDQLLMVISPERAG
jgi:pyruvate carboxylase subunit B